MQERKSCCLQSLFMWVVKSFDGVFSLFKLSIRLLLCLLCIYFISRSTLSLSFSHFILPKTRKTYAYVSTFLSFNIHRSSLFQCYSFKMERGEKIFHCTRQTQPPLSSFTPLSFSFSLSFGIHTN
jgi:hypothetical protein